MNDEAGKYESGISEDAGCYAEDDRAGSRTAVTEKNRKIHRPPSDDRWQQLWHWEPPHLQVFYIE